MPGAARRGGVVERCWNKAGKGKGVCGGCVGGEWCVRGRVKRGCAAEVITKHISWQSRYTQDSGHISSGNQSHHHMAMFMSSLCMSSKIFPA